MSSLRTLTSTRQVDGLSQSYRQPARPPFPLNNEMTLEDIKRIIKDEINDHEHRHHEH